MKVRNHRRSCQLVRTLHVTLHLDYVHESVLFTGRPNGSETARDLLRACGAWNANWRGAESRTRLVGGHRKTVHVGGAIIALVVLVRRDDDNLCHAPRRWHVSDGVTRPRTSTGSMIKETRWVNENKNSNDDKVVSRHGQHPRTLPHAWQKFHCSWIQIQMK